MNHQFEHVVDGLAKRGYAVVDRFLSPIEVVAILQLDEFKAGMLQFKKAGIGSGRSHAVNESIRGDHVHWIDRQGSAPELKVYFDRLYEMMSDLNENLFLSLKDIEVHLTVYPPGSYYRRHLDQFQADDHRRLSVVLYLNDQWEEEHGGQLRLYLPGQSEDILPTAGRMVCFRSDLVEHEVLPATRERLSITGWMLDQFAELKHL